MAGDGAVVRDLPFALDWAADAGDAGGVLDRDNTGTGFPFVYPNKNNDEYQPALIDVQTDAGLLRITSAGTAAAGGNYNLDNTLVNGLATQFDGSPAGG